MKYKFLLIITLLIIPFISANGLNINQDYIQINKTSGIDKQVQIIVSNEENFDFYNISADKIFSFEKFDLDSGESLTINATIKSDDNFDGDVRFQGDYFANLGQSNDTEVIKITSLGLDICDLDLIRGDRVNWINDLEGDVKLKNLDSGEYFKTIAGKSNDTEIFDIVQDFTYQVYKAGLPISLECNLNIQPTEGYVHSLEYDFIMNVDLNIVYEETNIDATFYTEDYNLDYNEDIEDVILVKNTGSKTAKNIHISADWFEFYQNDFDLDSGQQKIISYKIDPIIFQTNQTNQTYTKQVKIQGNFDEIEKDIDIFINYKNLNLTDIENIFDVEYGEQFVSLFCKAYPESDICRQLSGDISQEQNSNVTIQVGQDAYLEGLIEEDSFREETRTFFKYNNEILSLYNESLSQIINNNNKTEDKLQIVIDENESLRGWIIFGVSGLVCVIGLIVLYFLSKEYDGKSFLKLLNKGERKW